MLKLVRRNRDAGFASSPTDDVKGVVIGAAAATPDSNQEQCLPPTETKEELDRPAPPIETVIRTVVERPPPETFVETETVATILTTTSVVTTTILAPAPETSGSKAALPGTEHFKDKRGIDQVSIPVTSVVLPSRLKIIKVSFRPDPWRTRGQPVTMIVRIVDTEGRFVRKADVVVLATRYGRFPPEEIHTKSCFDGWAYVTLTPTPKLVPRPGGRVVLLVRAHKQKEELLAGVSARRLVYFVWGLLLRASSLRRGANPDCT